MKLSIVVPCYNEEPVLRETTVRLSAVLNSLVEKRKISSDSFILYVNDGSRDMTWAIIESLHDKNPYVKGLNLAGNVGHQNALMAGLMTAKGYADVLVSIDADLQDDVSVIEEMVDRYKEGYDIVYGVRSSRDSDTFFKKNTALAFYKLMSWLGVKSVYNHADYRLMSRTALTALSQYKESNLFLRGLVPSLGFKTAKVYYKRGTRVAGESKYPLKKMVSFAVEGVTSFSTKPLSMITGIGLFSVFIGIIMLIYTLVSVFSGHAVAGWGSIMFSLWILGGFILLALGITGEYIAKIYMEVKARPRYIIETTI